jgi:hypothetical protein
MTLGFQERVFQKMRQEAHALAVSLREYASVHFIGMVMPYFVDAKASFSRASIGLEKR